MSQLTFSEVRDYWNLKAEKQGHCPQITCPDLYFRLHVMEYIGRYIRPEDYVLDAGCGTGFNSAYYASKAAYVKGVDVCPNMIYWADKFIEDPHYYYYATTEWGLELFPETCPDNLSFFVGDITDLFSYDDSTFDFIICERVISSIPSTLDQYKAIVELTRILKPTGSLWMLVRTDRALERFNVFRDKAGLEDIVPEWWQTVLEEDFLAVFLEKAGYTVSKLSFDTYSFFTKVLHPAAVYPDTPDYISPKNHTAMQIASQAPTYRKFAKKGEIHCSDQELEEHVREFGFTGCSDWILFKGDLLDKSRYTIV